MSNENTLQRDHLIDGIGRRGQTAPLSRRRLLVTATGALAVTLPALAATRVGADTTARAGNVEQASERQRRIAAILERHGPELGSGR